MIDWQFFFLAWELKGKFPAILEQPVARELFDDANALLDKIIADGSFQARGATASGRRTPRATTSCSTTAARFPMLRQQTRKPTAAPTGAWPTTSRPAGDHLGGFAVTIHGADELAAALRGRQRRLPGDHGEGAGRPAGRGLRRIPAPAGAAGVVRARRQPERRDLHAERFRGIRPALGYPACPDHSEKQELFELLGAEDGMDLTESFAMSPAASVSGLIFAHPQASYFTVGRIGRDQVEDYAAARGARGRGGALGPPEPRLTVGPL